MAGLSQNRFTIHGRRFLFSPTLWGFSISSVACALPKIFYSENRRAFLGQLPYYGGYLIYSCRAFCIGRRDVPFSEMRTVDIDYTRGKWGGRFTVKIHREKGLIKCFVLPADEKGKRQLKDLERALFQHRIGVRKWGY